MSHMQLFAFELESAGHLEQCPIILIETIQNYKNYFLPTYC